MRVVYKTLFQLTIVSRIMALSFENIIKSLPVDIPGEFKDIMMKMYMKHPKVFDAPESDLEAMFPTEPSANTHDNRMSNSIFVKEKTVSQTKMDIKGPNTNTKVSSNINNIVRSDNTTTSTTAPTTTPSEENTEPTVTTKVSDPPPIVAPPPPPPVMAPVPLPIPLPLPMPMYPRVPVILPMKAYFEPVIHDHPPIYEIQDLIRADKKKWKHRHHKKNSQPSLEKQSESDADTDTSSEETDFGSDYYDALIHING